MIRCAVFFAAAVMAMPSARAAVEGPKAAPAERAEVVFVAPEKFTDARDSYTGTDAGRDAILNQLREYVLLNARRMIPAGDRLFVSITDVDLAGEFEPWRGARWDDVRIVKDIYPPRIDLSFRLVDAAGHVIKEGNRLLRDDAFWMTISAALRDDPLCHEKALLDTWFRTDFGEFNKH